MGVGREGVVHQPVQHVSRELRARHSAMREQLRGICVVEAYVLEQIRPIWFERPRHRALERRRVREWPVPSVGERDAPGVDAHGDRVEYGGLGWRVADNKV